jgi:8-oxo-dGTP diphosphatase
MSKSSFNVRVYGLFINVNNQVLLSDEEVHGKRFTKFPGGGLEYGEGLIDALKREFLEECNLAVDIISHFYTTDFFVESIFGGGQLISVYYLVRAKADITFKISEKEYDFDDQDGESMQCFRWITLSDLEDHMVTFPVDKYVVKVLKEKFL